MSSEVPVASTSGSSSSQGRGLSNVSPISSPEPEERSTGLGASTSRDDLGDVSMKDANGDDGEGFDGAYYEDSEEDDDPDDPIVRTLPVFLTPALASSLALLQYPHRPPAHHTAHPLLPPSLRPTSEDDYRPRDASITARYKPKVGQLELSVPLEVQEGKVEHRYNEERAKELGRGIQETDLGETGSGASKATNGVSGRGKKDNMLAYEEGNNTPLVRMTLSGDTVPDQTWYTCAVVKDNEVHLTPMTRTLQMRAYLSYLDRIENLSKQNARRERQAKEGSDDEDMSGGGSDDDEQTNKSAAAIAARKQKKAAAAEKKKANDEVKAYNVSIKTAGDDGLGKGPSGDTKTGRAAASLFGPIKAAEQEQWVDMPFHDPTTNAANRVYDKLFASNTTNLKMLTKATSYLQL